MQLEEIHRNEWGRLLSALIRSFNDWDLAEDALQDAFASAVVAWQKGVPDNPRGWLYTAARHNALDQIRRRQRFADKQTLIVESAAWSAGALTREDEIPDERLRLIFTCCHPALAPEAQVALTLRTLCGLTTEEIARAFLVPVATMAQRLVRAKAKIREAKIPYRVPDIEELPARLDEVMAVIYLVFNEGYSTPSRHELCSEAIHLARLVRDLLPGGSTEFDALLALMLFHDSRRNARFDGNGDVILLADQDRRKWDGAEIGEAGALLRSHEGPYAIEAAIAAVHAAAERAEDTDWPQIAALYERLYTVHQSPVVALNRAVAVSMAEGPAAALPLVDELESTLGSYHLYHATRADLLRRLGRTEEAIAAYERAHDLAQSDADRRFLAARIRNLRASRGIKAGTNEPRGRP